VITLNLIDLKNLLTSARKAGTVDRWADIAVEWMEGAQKEIDRLNQEKKETRK
jgi:hypothetical protein